MYDTPKRCSAILLHAKCSPLTAPPGKAATTDHQRLIRQSAHWKRLAKHTMAIEAHVMKIMKRMLPHVYCSPKGVSPKQSCFWAKSWLLFVFSLCCKCLKLWTIREGRTAREMPRTGASAESWGNVWNTSHQKRAFGHKTRLACGRLASSSSALSVTCCTYSVKQVLTLQKMRRQIREFLHMLCLCVCVCVTVRLSLDCH